LVEIFFQSVAMLNRRGFKFDFIQSWGIKNVFYIQLQQINDH